MTLPRLKAALLAAALTVASVPAVQAANLSGQHTDMKVKELSTGAYLVRLIFDLDEWNSGQNHTIRHFCPPGVEMSSPGFSILKSSDTEGNDAAKLRRNIRLTNLRNMIGANGAQGVSWYLRNDGEYVGPVRLEISFVARPVGSAQ